MAQAARRESPTHASVWRIEFARELAPFYSGHEKVRAIILSGSPPKGLSDAYSDLDMIVFWDEIDVAWLESAQLRDLDCERVYFRELKGADILLESYYFGALKVDFGHVTKDAWKKTVDEVLVDHSIAPSSQGPLGGFLHSLPLWGEEFFREWHARVEAYPDELAEKMVRGNLRLFVEGYLLHQAFGRGDVLAYYDGVCRTLKTLLDILAGLNRMYSFTEEPRWIEYYLSRIEIRPENAWERVRATLLESGEPAVEILEGLIDDVLDLVAERMPAVDVAGLRERRAKMRVGARHDKPRAE